MNYTTLRLKLNFLAQSLAWVILALFVPTMARAALSLQEQNAMQEIQNSQVRELKIASPTKAFERSSKRLQVTQETNRNARWQPPTQIAQNSVPVSTLSDLERQVLEEMNRARTNPGAYADWLESMKSYYYGNLLQLPGQQPIRTQEGVRAVDEAIRFLRSQPPLPPLNLSLGMSMAAKDHVSDMGGKGTIGHYGSDGSQFLDRIGRYGTSNGAVGENISYGVTTAQAVVMQLIIDDGVAGRFHRDNIFYNEFNTTGVACGPHRRYEEMCTIVYSADYRDRVALTPNPTPPPVNPTRIAQPSASPALSTPTVPPAEIVVETPAAPPPSAAIAVPPVPPAEIVVETPTPTPAEFSGTTVPTPPAIAEITVNTPAEVVVETPTTPANSDGIGVNSAESPVETTANSPASETTPSAADLALPSPPPANGSAASSAAIAPPPASPPANPPATAVTLLQEEGTLADGDSVYERDGSLYDVYTFQGRAGQAIAITVESGDFDTFLALFDEGDEIVGQNDDIDENNTNSFLEVTLPRDGTYRIFINGYDARDRGSYKVKVVE